MSSNLSIRVDDDVKQMLDTFAEKSNIEKNEIINQALRHYIYLQEVKTVREVFRPYAEAQGFRTEEDVFDSIS
ncbi:MAG: ribbon-helix-helix protein, CopG family [bacterium]|nr:ribbon-helix-helix protein, CopG family [bacterium]